MKFRKILLTLALCTMCVGQASALEYTYDAPEDYLFGRPTSSSQAPYHSLHPVDEAHSFRCSSSSDCNRFAGLQSDSQEDPNVDRSKNVALVPPGFGTPTSSSQVPYHSLHPADEAHSFHCSSSSNCNHYVGLQLDSFLPGSGEALTPNLIPGALNGGLVNQIGSVNYPAIDSGAQAPSVGSNFSYTTQPNQTQAVGFTEVTDDLYYSGSHLGTLKIPAIGLSVKVYQGTDSKTLAKGAGHFTETSIWDGNVCVAAHNRGVNAHFGKIHTLEPGDTITLTTKLGTRSYAVTSVEKVSEMDTSGTAATSDNRLTLYTCVRDERDFRWKVTAMEVSNSNPA